MHPVLRAIKQASQELYPQDCSDAERLFDRAQAILDAEDTPQNFDEFWKLYPRKDGKDPARKAWKKMGADQAWPQIQQNIRRRLAAKNWENTPERRQYIPMATTYLNQRRWLDVVLVARTGADEGYGL